MTDIDFLPSSYREQYVQRRATMLRLLLVVSVAATILAAAVSQHAQRRRLMAELVQVQLVHKEATARQAMLAELEGRLKKASAVASLLTYLREPWPRSQILTEVVRPLPESITLERIEFIEEQQASDAPAAQRAFLPEQDQSAEKPDTPPAVDDLETLRKRNEGVQTLVVVTGQTSDHGALHSYLVALGGSKLIANAQLASVEEVQGEEAAAIRFAARLTIRAPLGGDAKSPETQVARSR